VRTQRRTPVIYDLLLEPFIAYGFMRRALVACLALAVSVAPVGVFLMLRRMSLTGDALAHAILPGVAVGFLIAGLSLPAMTAGGIIAGLVVMGLAGAVARATLLREDATLAAFHLVSLASGVVIIAAYGSSVDLMHILFGSVLALDDGAIVLIASIASLTVLAMAMLWRPLVLECVDAQFLRQVSGLSPVAHFAFLGLLVLNLVGGFQALGTLMVVGLMILPAAAARFWARDLAPTIFVAAAAAFSAGLIGLLVSYHAGVPSGPAIVLVAGAFYGVSVIAGARGSLLAQRLPRRHLQA
jgi:zinc/manganese transport system permease protein